MVKKQLSAEEEIELLEEFFSEEAIEEFTQSLSEEAFSELIQVLLIVKQREERMRSKIKQLEERFGIK